MNESGPYDGQLDKDSELRRHGYEFTTASLNTPAPPLTQAKVHISDIVTCCTGGPAKTTATSPPADQRATQLRRFYESYDPTVGLHTAAVLGGILSVLILYLLYKSKCKKAIKKGFNFACKKLNENSDNKKIAREKMQEMPNITRLMAKTGTWIRIDSPGVLPTSEIDALEATAQWVENHPVEIQGLHDVTGIILKIDPDLIQAHDMREKPWLLNKPSTAIIPPPKGQWGDSLDSLRKTMLAQNHIGFEMTSGSSSKYLAVPSVSYWGTPGSSSHPNFTEFFYAQEHQPRRKTSDHLTNYHRREMDSYPDAVFPKIPLRICYSGNVQIHRTTSPDDLLESCDQNDDDDGCMDTDTSSNSEMSAGEPLLQHVTVEGPAEGNQQQYSWRHNKSSFDNPGSSHCGVGSNAEMNQPLQDLLPSNPDHMLEIKSCLDIEQIRMETKL